MRTIPSIVFDVDLTLTSQKYVDDFVTNLTENRELVNLALGFRKSGIPLIISTARPEYLREDTVSWLAEKGIHPLKVYMRPNDDGRPDWLVKLDHINTICSDYGKPLMWFDDKPENCQLVQSFGIYCVRV